MKRLQELAKKHLEWIDRKLRDFDDVPTTAQSVKSRMCFWNESDLSDDDLRLTLWIYLREALGLEPRLTPSTRGAGVEADEIAAVAINIADPPGLARRGPWTQYA